ncbi:MAG: TrmH family RNA methyltransferase [Pseudomonadota bacterium]
MSGTDRDLQAAWAGPQPVMVLVRPQMGENIGSAARAMLNFGLEHMRLVAPRDGWPNPAAVAMASGAARVLDAARMETDVSTAVQDLTHVYATTARPRDLTKEVMTPKVAMADARARIDRGERVGVLFGPERAGLENADIIPANTVISVPVNPGFASLNLAQCVLLVGYEWGQAMALSIDPQHDRVDLAMRADVTRLAESLVAQLDRAGFFWPDGKRRSLRENLENLLFRLPLTDPDIRTLYGVFRTLAEKHPARRDGS